MGYIVEHNDKTVWSPGRLVGKLFLSQVRHLESEVGVSAGLNEYMSDTIAIDANQLELFLQRVADWATFDNLSMRLLLRGAVVHLLALISCVERLQAQRPSPFPVDWLQESADIASKSMTMSRSQ